MLTKTGQPVVHGLIMDSTHAANSWDLSRLSSRPYADMLLLERFDHAQQ